MHLQLPLGGRFGCFSLHAIARSLQRWIASTPCDGAERGRKGRRLPRALVV
jgi:hypothetical protein